MTINVNTLLFAGDQIVIQSNEDDIQRSNYLLDKISPDYNMKISVSKAKSMASKGKEPVRKFLIKYNISVNCGICIINSRN